jgi:hypothetical protein
MTEEEFMESLDSLLERGLIEGRLDDDGEMRYFLTPLGQSVVASMNNKNLN